MPALADSAFESLYRREFPRLASALGSAFGRSAAADAVQEAFIRAGLRWGRVGQLTDPAGWVRHVAVNLLRNEVRDRRRRSRILQRESASRGSLARFSEPQVLMSGLIQSLPHSQRACVALYYVSDYSVREVAEALGVSEGAVKRYLSDARAALRKGSDHDGIHSG